MTPDEYAADITALDHADEMPDPEYLKQEYEDWKRGRCYNCGTWALENPWHEGEYECPVCGDIWNVYESAPQVP